MIPTYENGHKILGNNFISKTKIKIDFCQKCHRDFAL